MSKVFYVPYPLRDGRLKCGSCFRGRINPLRPKTRCKVCRKWNWNRDADRVRDEVSERE